MSEYQEFIPSGWLLQGVIERHSAAFLPALADVRDDLPWVDTLDQRGFLIDLRDDELPGLLRGLVANRPPRYREEPARLKVSMWEKLLNIEFYTFGHHQWLETVSISPQMRNDGQSVAVVISGVRSGRLIVNEEGMLVRSESLAVTNADLARTARAIAQVPHDLHQLFNANRERAYIQRGYDFSFRSVVPRFLQIPA